MRNAARLSFVASLLTLALLAPGGRASAASDRLPDLAMAKLRHIGTTKTADGRRLLRFSAIIVNVGEGPFELRSRRADGSSRWSTRQVIVDDAGGSRSVATPSVKLVYEGDGHDHWHVKDLEQYRLVPLRSARPDRIGQKVGFCFFDNYEYDLSLPDAPLDPVYGHRGCGTRESVALRTGLSVGWGDIYHRRLPGQSIDITDLPGGIYRLWAAADQADLFLESDDGNNSTWADLRIDARGVRVLRKAASP
jgi:lysyl oxidase